MQELDGQNFSFIKEFFECENVGRYIRGKKKLYAAVWPNVKTRIFLAIMFFKKRAGVVRYFIKGCQ